MTIRVERQVRPTTEVGSIKISPTAFQGEFAARQGLERAIGQGAVSLVKNMENLQRTTELANAQVSYDQQFRAFQATELTNPDHVGSTARFDKFHIDTSGAITGAMKNGRARRQADTYFRGLQSRRGTAVQADAFRRQAAEAQALITPNLESYAQQFTDARTEGEQQEILSAADTYLELLHTGDPDDPSVPGNLLNSAQLIQRQEEWDNILEETTRADAFVKARDTAMSFATVEDAVGFVDSLTGVLDRPDREDLLAQVKRQFSAREAEETEALEAQQIVDRQSILDRFIAKEYENIDVFINSLSLDVPEKLSWIEKSEARTKAINEGKEDPFLQTDSATYFETYRKIQADPDSVSEDDLADLVGKGEGGELVQQELTTLPQDKEAEFQTQFAKVSASLNINSNPDDPRHFYDYRGLFKETGKLATGPQAHFPSKFKLLGHPNLIVNGKDTRTGEVATPELIEQNKVANEQGGRGVTEGGISIADYEKLLGMTTDATNPLLRPANKRAQAAIQRMRSVELQFEQTREKLEEDIIIEDKYLGIANDLDAFIQANPDVTDEQIDAKTRQLLQPQAEAVTIGMFEDFLNPLGFEKGTILSKLFGRTKTPEPKTQAEFDALLSGTIFIDSDGARVRKR